MIPPTDSTTATVTIKPSWFAAVFHAMFTKPGLEIDGKGHELHWGSNDVQIPASAHRIGVYFRYRGMPTQRLALTEKIVDNGIGTRVIARLGARNSARFRIIEP